MTRPLSWAVVAIAVVLGVSGVTALNTDPSLLSYFDEDSELYNGIYYVDENGGSNPLLLVVRRDDAVKLDNGESYEKM